MPDPVGLVIFDCDGVLVDSEPLAVRICSELLASLGHDVSEEEVTERYVGCAASFMVADMRTRGMLPEGFDWDATFDPHFREAVLRDLRPVPGIEEALDRIEVPTCVASGGSHDKMRMTLGATGLYERFAGCLFSQQDVTRGKPAPDLFLHAAAAMGVEPERCIVVEDARHGIEAARTAGMRSLGYVGGLAKREWLEGPGTTIFSDMAELPGLIDQGTNSR
ncbi:MAG: HAD family hydrolase [Demequinaceae bacterium]|nr:HAD family hydrolase [Demequinaceae bacterium]